MYDSATNTLNVYDTGEGFNWQAGYLFKNKVEIAGRYSHLTPQASTKRNDNTQYTLGISKYIKRHFLKLQSDLTLIRETTLPDKLMYRLKLEFSL